MGRSDLFEILRQHCNAALAQADIGNIARQFNEQIQRELDQDPDITEERYDDLATGLMYRLIIASIEEQNQNGFYAAVASLMAAGASEEDVGIFLCELVARHSISEAVTRCCEALAEAEAAVADPPDPLSLN